MKKKNKNKKRVPPSVKPMSGNSISDPSSNRICSIIHLHLRTLLYTSNALFCFSD